MSENPTLGQLDELIALRIVADILMSEDPETTGQAIIKELRSNFGTGNVEASERALQRAGLPRLVFERSARLPRALGNVGQNWRRALG